MTVHFVRSSFVFMPFEELDYDTGHEVSAHLELNVCNERGYDLTVNEILNNQKIAYLVRKHIVGITKSLYNYNSEETLADELEELVKVYEE